LHTPERTFSCFESLMCSEDDFAPDKPRVPGFALTDDSHWMVRERTLALHKSRASNFVFSSWYARKYSERFHLINVRWGTGWSALARKAASGNLNHSCGPHNLLDTRSTLGFKARAALGNSSNVFGLWTGALRLSKPTYIVGGIVSEDRSSGSSVKDSLDS
jgi:hypothetical protein